MTTAEPSAPPRTGWEESTPVTRWTLWCRP